MPQDDPHHHRTLSRAVRTIFSVTLVSRLAGMVRDVVIGRIFGNTAVGSAFLAAFQIPNLFRRLFGEGALSAAFIPMYTEAEGDTTDPGAGPRFASLTLAILAAVTTGLTVLAEVIILVLLLLLPRDPERDLSLRLIMVMLPYMPLICTAAILAGMLQVHNRFGYASAGPLLLNAFVVVIGGYFLITGQLAHEEVAYVLGVATVLSGVTQCMWFARLLRPQFRWTSAYATAVPRARMLLRRFLPVALGLGTLQLNTFVDTLIAMYPIWVGATLFGFAYPLDEASNSVLSLTTRLYQFPLGVFGIAVATAVFPLLAKSAADPERFLAMLRRGLRLSLFIGIPATVGLFLIRRDVTFVMFSGGSTGFDARGAAKSAAVLAGHATGIWAYSLNHVFARAFYAKGDTMTPMKVAVVTVGVNFVLNLTLIWWLEEAGMAWATSLAAMVQCGILWHLVRRRTAPAGSRLLDAETGISVVKVVGASAIMGGGVYAVLAMLPVPTTWTMHLVALCASMVAGLVIFFGLTVPMRMRELGWLVKGK